MQLKYSKQCIIQLFIRPKLRIPRPVPTSLLWLCLVLCYQMHHKFDWDNFYNDEERCLKLILGNYFKSTLIFCSLLFRLGTKNMTLTESSFSSDVLLIFSDIHRNSNNTNRGQAESLSTLEEKWIIHCWKLWKILQNEKWQKNNSQWFVCILFFVFFLSLGS